MWDNDGGAYINVAKLSEILSKLPPYAVVRICRDGNTLEVLGSHLEDLGYIDFCSEEMGMWST